VVALLFGCAVLRVVKSMVVAMYYVLCTINSSTSSILLINTSSIYMTSQPPKIRSINRTAQYPVSQAGRIPLKSSLYRGRNHDGRAQNTFPFFNA
jgi:hypothetical protein